MFPFSFCISPACMCSSCWWFPARQVVGVAPACMCILSSCLYVCHISYYKLGSLWLGSVCMILPAGVGVFSLPACAPSQHVGYWACLFVVAALFPQPWHACQYILHASVCLPMSYLPCFLCGTLPDCGVLPACLWHVCHVNYAVPFLSSGPACLPLFPICVCPLLCPTLQ
jgi:hypothetical protein